MSPGVCLLREAVQAERKAIARARGPQRARVWRVGVGVHGGDFKVDAVGGNADEGDVPVHVVQQNRFLTPPLQEIS
jgi:hypothetical protein